MLDLLSTTARDCERVSRRSLLQIGALGGLGVTLPGWLAARSARGNDSPLVDRNCIAIWTHGGTSHHDTFDPKPLAPVSVKGEFGVVSTTIPGVQFADVIPNLARNLDRFALLRSWNPENGSHGIADQVVMSGRKFNPALHYPTFGSVVSWNKGFKSPLPPFVQLGTNMDHRFGGGMPGILGLEHGPFEIVADPAADNFTVRDITPPTSVPGERMDRRQRMLTRIDKLQRNAELQPAAFNALDQNFEAAFNMITAPGTKQAFKLEEEPAELRDRYGRNRFGQSCLLARRMIEAGVRFVTITDPGWDTHQDNFKSLKNSRVPPIDQGLPALLTDLEDRGLLESTLVVLLTDFGRTPQVNSASGRDHWASAGFVVFAGAGIPGGAVLGATDDEGGKPISHEYFSENVAATIYQKIGLPLDLIATAPDGRPVQLLEGHAPIKEWA
jgi:hypothetical protein